MGPEGARVELIHGAVGRFRYDRGLFDAFGAKSRAEKARDGLGAEWEMKQPRDCKDHRLSYRSPDPMLTKRRTPKRTHASMILNVDEMLFTNSVAGV